jgi:ribonuclease R
LVGRRWGQVYRLGDRVQVRLIAAQPLTGGITFELIEGGGQDAPPLAHPRAKPSKRKPDRPGRPAGPRIPSRKTSKSKRRR